MQAVGFGIHTNGQEFIIVRNQWGTGWGDNGFVKVFFDKTSTVGTCGIYVDNYRATTGF